MVRLQEWYRDDKMTVGYQQSVKFTHDLFGIRHVFQHCVTKYRVVTFARLGDISQVTKKGTGNRRLNVTIIYIDGMPIF